MMRHAFFTLFFLSTFSFIQAQERFGGAMLYTVREEMKNNPEKTIAEVGAMGYEYLELAGYNDGEFYGMTPENFSTLLQKNGLRAVSSHHGEITLENADKTIADVKALGIPYLVVPIPPMGMFTHNPESNKMGLKGSSEKLVEILNVLGKKCSEEGIKLLYHNHDFEFEKNENDFIIIDYLLKNTDPTYVNFQMDLFWTTKAGADPLAYFDRFPGRFKSFHVKDRDAQGRFSPVGEGVIDFQSIIVEKEKAGMEFFFVEQDRTSDGITPLEALKISHSNLRSLGF